MGTSSDILKARILIVDDKEANVQLIAGMLRVAGYTCVQSTTDPTKVCDLHRMNRYGLILLGTCLYILNILGIAILMSTISDNQQQALVGTFFFAMPTLFLSGFAFPIGSMPPPMQWFSHLIPLRYYLVIIRASFLKGVPMAVLWPQLAALAAASLTLLTISVVTFHKSLD